MVWFSLERSKVKVRVRVRVITNVCSITQKRMIPKCSNMPTWYRE